MENSYKVGVLHRKCARIQHKHITAIQRIPELAEAVRAYDGEYTDESVCEIVYQTATRIPRRGITGLAGDIIEDVYGSIDNTPILDGYEDQRYLIPILKHVGKFITVVLMRDELFLKTARERGILETTEDVCLVFESVFHNMMAGFEDSEQESQRQMYSVSRKIAKRLGLLVFQNKDHFWETYSEKCG